MAKLIYDPQCLESVPGFHNLATYGGEGFDDLSTDLGLVLNDENRAAGRKRRRQSADGFGPILRSVLGPERARHEYEDARSTPGLALDAEQATGLADKPVHLR
jgi:hypothetical protein